MKYVFKALFTLALGILGFLILMAIFFEHSPY